MLQMLPFKYYGQYPMYHYVTAISSASGSIDDFGNLFLISNDGMDCIFRGTYEVGY